jgi:hypothetical protein
MVFNQGCLFSKMSYYFFADARSGGNRNGKRAILLLQLQLFSATLMIDQPGARSS